jgi:hypothetical protein
MGKEVKENSPDRVQTETLRKAELSLDSRPVVVDEGCDRVRRVGRHIVDTANVGPRVGVATTAAVSDHRDRDEERRESGSKDAMFGSDRASTTHNSLKNSPQAPVAKTKHT